MRSLLPVYNDIETERLTLRCIHTNDALIFSKLRSDATVNRYIRRQLPYDEAAALAWIQKQLQKVEEGSAMVWLITDKLSSTAIGSICLWNFTTDQTVAETGYELFPEHRGNGYMTEALFTVLKFSKDVLKLESVEAFTHRENARSIKMLRNSGFIHQPERRDVDVEENVIYVYRLD